MRSIVARSTRTGRREGASRGHDTEALTKPRNLSSSSVPTGGSTVACEFSCPSHGPSAKARSPVTRAHYPMDASAGGYASASARTTTTLTLARSTAARWEGGEVSAAWTV